MSKIGIKSRGSISKQVYKYVPSQYDYKHQTTQYHVTSENDFKLRQMRLCTGVKKTFESKDRSALKELIDKYELVFDTTCTISDGVERQWFYLLKGTEQHFKEEMSKFNPHPYRFIDFELPYLIVPKIDEKKSPWYSRVVELHLIEIGIYIFKEHYIP